ncbi:hypothetical protein FRC12_011520, partial [Ceratobasidium sp. 428]
MREILQGLAHLHSLSPPVVHGDLKFQNILISREGSLKLCDFGRSQFASDDTADIPNASSTFHATYRYMSPELFGNKRKAKPTMYSDVWAYGCVALQLLSGLLPYHTIKSDIILLDSISKGVLPSIKPERPYAPRCLNEHLWGVIRSCWNQANYRPASFDLLRQLNQLLRLGLIDSLPATPDRMSIDFEDKLPDWPQEIVKFNFKDNARRTLECSSSRADVYTCHYPSGQPRVHSTSATSNASNTSNPRTDGSSKYVIKVPKPTNSPETEQDAFLFLLRSIVRERYSLQHQNIVEMVGIDTSFQPYPGLVFEYCGQYSLDQYGLSLSGDAYIRTQLMIDILAGLRYLHTFPTPIPHGDLQP